MARAKAGRARRWRRGIGASLLLLGLALEAPAQEPLGPRQVELFRIACAHCHLREGIGVPVAGRSAEWAERGEQGFAVLLRHTIEGIRDMPPLGTCGACTEQDFRALVAFLAGLAAAPPEPGP